MSSREAAANQSDDLRAVGVSREAGAGGTILKVKIILRVRLHSQNQIS